MTPYITCAANWVQDGWLHVHQPRGIETGYVVAGHRHHNCFYTMSLINPSIPRTDKVVQGFLTSDGRFVDRVEALAIARAAGQLEGRTKYRPLDELLSEDIY